MFIGIIAAIYGVLRVELSANEKRPRTFFLEF